MAEYGDVRPAAEPRGEGRSDESDSGGEPRRGYRRPGPDRRDMRRRNKICQFCAEKSKAIDYKNVGLLRQYVSERGRIFARRKTGTCARHQRILAQAIKRARQIALLPYASSHTRAGI